MTRYTYTTLVGAAALLASQVTFAETLPPELADIYAEDVPELVMMGEGSVQPEAVHDGDRAEFAAFDPRPTKERAAQDDAGRYEELLQGIYAEDLPEAVLLGPGTL